MMLPIDARKAPFKQKYIDEETPMLARWFPYGKLVEDESLCIGDANDSVFIGLTADQAVQLITARNEFVNTVLDVLSCGQSTKT